MESLNEVVATAIVKIRSGGEVDGRFLVARLDESRMDETMARDELFNSLALAVARQFQSGLIDYYEGDEITNALWWLMLETSIAPIAFAVYEAFDTGEFDRGDGVDRVKEFTVPMIRAILAANS